MDDQENLQPPAQLAAIERESAGIGFTLSCERQTGALLRTLAASKPGGRILELGTGTGAGSSWFLDSMDGNARLISIDREERHNAIAHKYLGQDSRATFLTTDATDFLQRSHEGFDLIFADSPMGKYTLLEECLALLNPGGFYVVDDLLPPPSGPTEYTSHVPALLASLEQRSDLKLVKLGWASGMLIATKVAV